MLCCVDALIGKFEVCERTNERTNNRHWWVPIPTVTVVQNKPMAVIGVGMIVVSAILCWKRWPTSRVVVVSKTIASLSRCLSAATYATQRFRISKKGSVFDLVIIFQKPLATLCARLGFACLATAMRVVM